MAELTNLETFEVSLVPKAANKRKFLILKSDEGGTDQMNYDEILKSVLETDLENEPEVDKVMKQAKLSDKATAACKSVLKTLSAYKDEMPKNVMKMLADLSGYGYATPYEYGDKKKKSLAKADGTLDLDGVPEDIKPALESLWKEHEDTAKKAQELEAQIKKAENEKVTKEYIEKAATYKNLAIKADEFGPVLKAIALANPDEYAKVEAVLKAADVALSKGGLFAEIGSAGGGEPATAWGKIEKSAEAMATKDKITKAAAVSKIIEENPNLYDEYLNEKGAK
jgi:hypothetical protein